MSFGPLDVAIDGGVQTYTHTISVVNKSTKWRSRSTPPSPASARTSPARPSAVSPATVSVPAATATADGTMASPVTVTLTVDPTQLLHTHDPSIAATQGGNLRDYKSEATGYVELTPTAA